MMRGAMRPGTQVLIAALLAATGCQPATTKTPAKTTAKTPAKTGTTTTPPASRPSRDTTPGATGTPPNGPQTPAGPGGDAGTGTNPPPVVPPVIDPAPPPTGGSSGGSGGGSSGSSLTGLAGFVQAPSRILSDNGASIVSNNGSRIISNNGSALIANNGAGIISNNGSAIISNNGSAYRLLASEPQKAVSNAFVYLTNRDEKYYLDANGKVLATTVGTGGKYQFASGFPVDKDVVVNAVMNGNLRMAGFVVPGASGATLGINLGSTMATEYLRGDAYRNDKSLKAYDQPTFREAAALSQDAIAAGEIPSVRTAVDQAGETVTVGRFDLRADHTEDLRNQYVVAFSATAVGNALLKKISDAWKTILGERPAAVTSLMGSGAEPFVETSLANYLQLGFAEGDTRNGEVPQTGGIPLGYNYSVAVAKTPSSYGGHQIFVGCATTKGSTGHVRWVRTDAAGNVKKVTTLWLPTYAVGHPLGICIEREPTGNAASPGSLLIADAGTNKVYRVFLVDDPVLGQTYDTALTTPFDADGDPGTPDEQVPYDLEKHLMEIVAGENEPLYPADDPYVGFLSVAHPFVVDPDEGAAYAPVDFQSGDPLQSRWRAADEGKRLYGTGTTVPQAARYAHLDQPYDVEVDERGNIYICDKVNHRIRFIPSTTSLLLEGDKNYFEYKTPVLNGDEEIDTLGAKATMVAGAIYTIAGNPDWDPARTPGGTTGWFGEYGGDGGSAQLAKFDSPYAIAWNNADKCLYVADFDNNRVRKISRDTGIVTSVAGNPTGGQRSNGQGDFDYAPGYSGDGGPATLAELSFPRGLAFDGKNRLYIADTQGGLIRMVDTDGTIRTVAGRYHDPDGESTDNADDGDARKYADLYDTEKIDVDPQGNVIFNDYRHGRLRKIWRQWEY